MAEYVPSSGGEGSRSFPAPLQSTSESSPTATRKSHQQFGAGTHGHSAHRTTTSQFTPHAYIPQDAFHAPPAQTAQVESHTRPAPAAYSNFPSVPYRQSNPQTHTPLPQQLYRSSPSARPPPNFTYMPGVAMSWDWEGAVDYTGLPDLYEPQGQLIREQQRQAEDFRGQEFNIPFPVPSSPENIRTATSTPVTANPLSPIPALQPPSRQTSVQSGMKRKAGSEPTSAESSVPASLAGDHQPPQKMSKQRTASQPTTSTIAAISADQSRATRSQTADRVTSPSKSGSEAAEVGDLTQLSKDSDAVSTNTKDKAASTPKARRIVEGPSNVPGQLPAGKVFPIQIGSELFRLSGASISSDAPSYFSRFFGEQLHGGPSRAGELKTLYIDRDPKIFRDIALHLQGYYVRPRDSEHFVKLFADAQFYSLPRLTTQLFKSEIFVDIGGQDFRISRDLFNSPGDSPNFFSLGFSHFFATPDNTFPGLDNGQLLRPPSIIPPSIANRSGRVFDELMRLMQGYPVNVRDESHRAELLRDARYFHLKGLEQRLLPIQISHNLLRNTSEILIRLEDIRQSGIGFAPDSDPVSSSSESATSPGAAGKPSNEHSPGFVSYMRPYADDSAHTLILEVGEPESMLLHFASSPSPTAISIRATFFNQALARVSSLFSVVASKLGLPATQPLGLMMMETGTGITAQPISPANSGISDAKVKVRIGADAFVEVDGVQARAEHPINNDAHSLSPRLLKRKTVGDGPITEETPSDELEDALDLSDEEEKTWVVRRSHWRLRLVPNETTGRIEVIMFAVRLEAFASERSRNESRGFLS